MQLILLLPIILGICWIVKIIYLDTPKAEGNPLTPLNIVLQKFTIDASQDTVLRSKAGTYIMIRKRSFTDDEKNPVEGKINLKFREVLRREDILLSGLTTTYNGTLLETDGMIFIDARSDGRKLHLADSAKITLAVPADSVDRRMRIFRGRLQNGRINWVKPSPLLNNRVKLDQVKEWDQDQKSLREAIEEGIILADTISENTLAEQFLVPADEPVAEQGSELTGMNYFREDLNQCYVFEMYYLGWANIDVLWKDERTRNVELGVTITNYQDFGEVYITLVIQSADVFLPGYQKVDKSFAFTHGDYEKTRLPLGEKATIIATAYKKGKPYLAIKSFTIEEDQMFRLVLAVTTSAEMKSIIASQI